MSDFEQIPYSPPPVDVFVDNPEPRCPCVLVLDKSGSMSGAPIEELNLGVATLKQELMEDSLASKRVELSVVSFGPLTVDCEFAGVPAFYPPALQASGDTPMGGAILRAIDMVERRKATYRQHGVAYYRPWIFLITDGAPTDSWTGAASQVRSGEQGGQFAFFAIGVRGADRETLARISVRAPLMLDGLRFRELFQWLSRSLSAVSRSQAGTSVPLPPPSGWASV